MSYIVDSDYAPTTCQLIGDPDILIAATAIHYNQTLLSRNLRHFRRISDLKLHEEG